ncbi:hypothetical protein N0V90_003155 [Kalmusia sp. IMI 367209]|nr:hypothetical protein N0V90_003155 [Kalmusia sp. IMI 367209]
MVTECCLSGFQWDGAPIGIEGKIAENKAYIVGGNEKVAILVVADLFGWTFINTRLLCDRYAEEANAAVYMPDFFGGEVIDPQIIANHNRWNEFNLEGWHKRNAKEARWDEIVQVAKALKERYERVGVIGYCYGGWSLFRLGGIEFEPRLVDCISTAHPTWLTKEEIDKIGVPVQICAPEIDKAFTSELKAYANEVIPTKGVPYDYQYFPGVEHSFATRGNLEDEKERRAMLRGKRAQVAWMKEWLHGEDGW